MQVRTLEARVAELEALLLLREDVYPQLLTLNPVP
jgi:hypothetical protein